MSKLRIFIMFFICLIILTGCFKRKSIGSPDEVLVLADKTLYNRYKDQLEQIFNKPIYTPQLEKRFSLHRIEKKDFGMKKEFKNIIMLFDIDSESPESKYLKSFFDESIIEGVRKGDYFYAFKNDQWARNQNLIFLMDSKKNGLVNFLDNQKYKDMLFDSFYKSHMDDIEDGLFDKHNNKEAEDSVLTKYGYDLIVPHDFRIINERKDDQNFVRFRRFLPDRWLTIIKGKYNDELTLKQNTILQRNETGQYFGDKVWINMDDKLSFTILKDTTFTKDGILMKGLWEFTEGGGPFFTYAFKKGNDLYLIDGSTYCPGKDKMPFLDQLDVMARRVRIK